MNRKKYLRCIACKNKIVNRRRGLVKTCSAECSLENKRRVQNKNNRNYQLKRLKQCSSCHKWFQRRMGGSKYCLNCYNEARTKEKRIIGRKYYWDWKKMIMTNSELKNSRGWGQRESKKLDLIVNCPHCKKKFKKIGNTRYCSLTCRRKTGHQKEKNLREVIKSKKSGFCIICNQIFKFENQRSDAVVCFESCRLEKNRKRAREWATEQRKQKNRMNKTKRFTRNNRNEIWIY